MMLLRILPVNGSWRRRVAADLGSVQDRVLALCAIIERFVPSLYVVTSPRGTALFPHNQQAVLLLPQWRTQLSALWRYDCRRLLPVAPVDPETLGVPSGGRRVFTAPSRGYYSPHTGFLPLVDSTLFGTPSRFDVLAVPQEALSEQMQRSQVLQASDVFWWLQTSTGYHALPQDGVLYEHGEQVWVQFDLDGTEALFIKPRGYHADPLQRLRLGIAAIPEAKRSMRYGMSYLYDALHLEDPLVQLGLIHSHPADRFLQALRDPGRTERYQRMYETMMAYDRLPINSLCGYGDDPSMEVLAVYRALDGSTGRFVWRPYQKEIALSNRLPLDRLLRIYRVSSGIYPGRGSKLLELLLALPGSSIYAAPYSASLLSLNLFRLDAQQQLVLDRDVDRISPPTITVQDLFIDSGRLDYRLLQPYMSRDVDDPLAELPLRLAH